MVAEVVLGMDRSDQEPGKAEDRVSCVICRKPCPANRSHSTVNVLKCSRATACEFLVKHCILTAEDVLDCGYLCSACLAVVRYTDQLDSALALSVKRLQRLKAKGAGGSFSPFVPRTETRKPHGEADDSNDGPSVVEMHQASAPVELTNQSLTLVRIRPFTTSKLINE